MRIRAFEQSDVPRILEIFHEQGFGYGEPDWSKVHGHVVVDDSWVIRIALLNRPTVEKYALIDGSRWAAPGMKATVFSRLDEVDREDLRRRGYQDECAWIPPRCRAFVRRLCKFFGWVRANDGQGYVPLVRWL